MAEVLIIASTDKQLAARRLEEAIGRSGYGVARLGMPPTYRHAQNMRLFCERSGRSTPQCREFRRRTGLGPAPTPVGREERPQATPAAKYRNARNMRLFCERAGRRTAECRAFRRSRQGGAEARTRS